MGYPLDHVYDEAATYAAFLAGTLARAQSVDDIGRLCNDLSGIYRTLGLCELLLEADTEQFVLCLVDSALMRRYFLERCKHEGRWDHPECRASYIAPFCDAVAVGQRSVAVDIKRSTPPSRFEGYEYESDHAYAWMLMCLADPEASGDVLECMLHDYEVALGGRPEARLAVCRALVEQNEAAFHPAMLELLAQFEAGVEQAEARAYRFDDHERIFVEGLALLRLADDRGIATSEHYRYCPALARRARVSASPELRALLAR
jgi:hypothetical protein